MDVLAFVRLGMQTILPIVLNRRGGANLSVEMETEAGVAGWCEWRPVFSCSVCLAARTNSNEAWDAALQ